MRVGGLEGESSPDHLGLFEGEVCFFARGSYEIISYCNRVSIALHCP